MDVCSFEPTVVRVPVGTTVRFLNTAPNDHAVAGRGQTWVSDDVLRPGAEFSERFDKAGIYPYACPLHVGMVGAVIVGEPVAAAGAGSEAPAAPVAAGDVAGTTSSATDTEATPVAPAAVAGLVGGWAAGPARCLRRRPTAVRGHDVRASPAKLDRGLTQHDRAAQAAMPEPWQDRHRETAMAGVDPVLGLVRHRETVGSSTRR